MSKMNNMLEILKDKLEQKLSDVNEKYHNLVDGEDIIVLSCEYDKSDLLDAKMQVINEILGIVYELAEEDEKENGWISVKEDSPKESQMVLCWCVANQWQKYMLAWYETASGVFDLFDVSDLDWKVVAWQPLPKEYEYSRVEEVLTCNDCGLVIKEGEELYEYAPGKWCCLNCLKDKFATKTVVKTIEEVEEQYYSSYDLNV